VAGTSEPLFTVLDVIYVRIRDDFLYALCMEPVRINSCRQNDQVNGITGSECRQWHRMRDSRRDRYPKSRCAAQARSICTHVRTGRVAGSSGSGLRWRDHQDDDGRSGSSDLGVARSRRQRLCDGCRCPPRDTPHSNRSCKCPGVAVAKRRHACCAVDSGTRRRHCCLGWPTCSTRRRAPRTSERCTPTAGYRIALHGRVTAK